MNTYYVHDPDEMEESDAVEVTYFNPVGAAEYFSEIRYSQDDHPESRDLIVRDSQGKRYVIRVEAAQTVEFSGQIFSIDGQNPGNPE